MLFVSQIQHTVFLLWTYSRLSNLGHSLGDMLPLPILSRQPRGRIVCYGYLLKQRTFLTCNSRIIPTDQRSWFNTR